MRDEEQTHMTSSGGQMKQTRAEGAAGKQMTALDLLARWLGHHYFIGYCYTLLPLEIKWRVDSCVEFAFTLATIHVPAYSSLHFYRAWHDEFNSR
jgi:hypothetical protein